MYIGYNIEKVNEAMQGISDAYRQLAEKIVTEFDSFSASLRKEWVGYDEGNFEEKLIKRLNELQENSNELAVGAIATVRSMAEAWIDFQDTNTIDGASSGTAQWKGRLINPSVPPAQTINMRALAIGSGENLGLTNEGSASTLSGNMASFVSSIKEGAKTLFGAVNTNTAFYGDQAKQISKFVEKVGEALGELSTSIKEFDEAMYTLTGGNYTASDASMSESIESGSSDLEASIDEKLGSSRWTE